MIVGIPSQFTRHNIYNLIDRVIDKDKEPMDHKINFDFSKLKFIEPVGVTVLSNLFAWLLKNQIECSLTIPVMHNYAIRYLDDSLFFEQHLGKKLDQSAAKRDTTISLQNVKCQESYDWLGRVLISWLAARLNLTRESLTYIKVCLTEIFNNINDHSNENIGCIFAQYYPQKDRIHIAVSDFGVGIPYNVQKFYPSYRDSQALLEATKVGFTTKSIPRNAGAGLDVLIKYVVDTNKGGVYIHSNYGILSSIYHNGCSSINAEDILSYYPGTLFDIVLRTDTIENVTKLEEEFEW